MSVAKSNTSGTASPTRALFAGGADWPATQMKSTDYLTIASTGNAQDFGDLTQAGVLGSTGSSSSTRGVYSGSGQAPYKHIELFIFTTLGNAIKFGDLTNTMGWAMGTGNCVRGVWGGGQSPTSTNIIEYISMQTEGNGVDFGDLITTGHLSGGACSNGHGGLG